MKWAFVVTAVLNLAYFIWEFDRQIRIDAMNAVNQPEPFRVSVDAKRLALLSELAELPAAITKNESAPPITNRRAKTAEANKGLHLSSRQTNLSMLADFLQTTTMDNLKVTPPQFLSASPVCVSYGPFTDLAQAQNLRNWFDEREITAQQRTTNKASGAMFWVYLFPGGTKETTAAMENLQRQGITDYQLINQGDLQNTISLGLFSSQIAVSRRLNEIKTKGFKPIVVPHHKSATVHWVDVEIEMSSVDVRKIMARKYPTSFNFVSFTCGGTPP